MNSLSAIAAEHGLEGDEEEWAHDMGGWQDDDEVRLEPIFPIRSAQYWHFWQFLYVQFVSSYDFRLALCFSFCHVVGANLCVHCHSAAFQSPTYRQHSTNSSSKLNHKALRIPPYPLSSRLTFHRLRLRRPTSAGSSP